MFNQWNVKQYVYSSESQWYFSLFTHILRETLIFCVVIPIIKILYKSFTRILLYSLAPATFSGKDSVSFIPELACRILFIKYFLVSEAWSLPYPEITSNVSKHWNKTEFVKYQLSFQDKSFHFPLPFLWNRANQAFLSRLLGTIKEATLTETT